MKRILNHKYLFVFIPFLLITSDLIWACLFRLDPTKAKSYGESYFECMPFIIVFFLILLSFLSVKEARKCLISACCAYLLQATSAFIFAKAMLCQCHSYWTADPFGACIWVFALSPWIGLYLLHRAEKQGSAIAAYLEGMAVMPTVLGLLPIIWSVSSTVQQFEGYVARNAYLIFHGM